jgi:hypothetical protein
LQTCTPAHVIITIFYKKKDRYTTKIDYTRGDNFVSAAYERAPINDHLDEVLYVLPFVTVTEFAREFLYEPPHFGSERTFARASKKCPNVRFMRCKGSMPTCGICDSIAQLLANTQFKHKLTASLKRGVSLSVLYFVILNAFIILDSPLLPVFAIA